MYTRKKFSSRLALAFLAGPLVLGLAACGSKSDDGTQVPKGEPIAAVSPPAGKAWSDVVSPTDAGGMRMGNPDAPIKVVEYGSLSCPHCAKLAQDGLKPLIEKYVDSGRVSYEFRSYAIHGIIDLPLTVLVKCASPDAFFPLVDQIYVNQKDIIDRAEKGNDQAKATSNLPPDKRWVALADAFGLTDWFASRGLPEDQAKACLAKSDDAQKVADMTQKWYKDDGVDSTPTLFINGRKTDIRTWGPEGSDPGLEAALQNAGAR